MTIPRDSRRALATYLVLVFGLSSVFYALIIHAGKIGAAGGMFVTGLMWCPALAALLTCRSLGRSVSTLGWTWHPRYQAMSYAIPVVYAMVAYLIIWLSGLGGFPNTEFLDGVAKAAGWGAMPAGVTLTAYVLLRATIGMVMSTASALGEEIGWRGFLVPELAKVTSFTGTALISGIIWSLWHFPELIFADYNNGTPAIYGLSCFVVLVVAISFVFAWMRLKSGSLWTGAFLHAAHNLWIQSILTPLTTSTDRSKWAIDEFGFVLPLVAIGAAWYFWRRRGELPNTRVSA